MKADERVEKIIESIKMQADAGFSNNEILKNLIKEGFSKSEVEPYLQNVSSLTSSSRQTLQSILIGAAVICGVKACDYAGSSMNGQPSADFWTFLIIGALAFILFIVLLTKKKPFNNK